ncbi:hypothetical protein H2204_013166 [Knufia peltigerae]|uniref:Uncharacterized protein n=1 Tax=Knufia peltigerae TaxID=1002370 RepID=A0AA39CRL2_9EURO|nr:hypothetical protein H2204_013166 [Knufia peltigerae]
MSKRLRDAELMGEDIIDTYLSEEPLCESTHPTESDEPKLRRFVVDGRESLQRPRLIGKGLHGVAILATIKGDEYVLKVFKHWKQPGPVYYRYDDAILLSPLACESRAYARLDSRNENDGIWAAQCYGWMRLSDPQFEELGNVVDVNKHDLSRWVVVKEYIPSPTLPCDLPEIFANFEIPKRARIVPRDARLDNYRGSKIVDLSSALTEPSPRWTKFKFELFYGNTTFGIFQWFKGVEHAYEPPPRHRDNHLLTGPLPL